MTLCPIAMAVGCRKCPVFGICPVKGVIGDHKKAEETKSARRTPKAKSGRKRGG